MSTENTRKKKILFLITKSNWGGAQRYVYDLATSLDQVKYEPVVVLGGNGVLKEQLEHAHIRTISLTSLQRDISIKKELAFTKELIHIIRSEKPTVLHVNSSKAGGVGTLLGRLLMVPRVIYTAHGWAFNEARPWWQKLVVKILHWITVLCSHTTIAVSRAIVTQLRWPLIQKKFVVINPGRTIGPMYGKREAREKLVDRTPSLQQHVGKKWIMHIAELHPIKRHDLLISAMERVVKKHPTAIAILIGGGELQHTLEKQIANLGLSDHIFMLGAITEAARFLKAADIFVLTSDSESYGYVVHEAGIAGVPVVATAVGGVTDIIPSQESGLLVHKGNVTELTSALEQSLTDTPAAQDRAKHLQALLANRTKEKMADATTAVYELGLK